MTDTAAAAKLQSSSVPEAVVLDDNPLLLIHIDVHVKTKAHRALEVALRVIGNPDGGPRRPAVARVPWVVVLTP